MRYGKGRYRLAAAVVAAVVAVAGCGENDGAGATGPSVVVSTTVLGDIVSSLAGDAVEVEVLFPIGADPHSYQPSSQQVAAMEQADLVVVNGLGLEEGLADVIEGVEADGANVVEVGALVEPIALGAGGHDHDDPAPASCQPEAGHSHADEEHEEGASEDGDHDHRTSPCDPHVWMDPIRIAEVVEHLGEELAAIAPDVDWAARVDDYAHELTALDEEVRDVLDTIPDERRVIVTNHESLGYFAARYDLEVVGTVVPGGSTMAEPSSADLSELVEIMRAEEVQVLFAETTNPDALGRAVADELGGTVEIVELFTGSLGEPDSEAPTYVDMIRTDAERIAEALRG